jgi:hypothetical protein
VDGVDGGEGPTVFPVPVLLAAPEEVGFRFLVFWMSRNLVKSFNISYKGL